METIDSALVRERLRAALKVAMKERDSAAMAAFRSAIAAMDNAGAVDASLTPSPDDTEIANAMLGAGAADVPRGVLSIDDVLRIIRAEIAERFAAAEQYVRLGRTDQASRLQAEADALQGFLMRTLS